MNISLMILTAIITTVGLIIITKYAGRKQVSYVKKILKFLVIAPFLIILIKLLFVMVINPDETSAASSTAAEKMIEMLPETVLSAFIGDAVGFVIWGIYRWVKRLI
jgi:hypothetical protein